MEEAEDGLTLCTARPEFAALSEYEVRRAITGDYYCENPITGEVTRLGAEFMARLRAYIEKRGCVPAGIVELIARCPIEKIAILAMICSVEARTGGLSSAALH